MVGTIEQANRPSGLLRCVGEHAFGNYRDLLHEVAIHPAMGNYLSMMGSTKENTSTGALPDENFARELMQLLR